MTSDERMDDNPSDRRDNSAMYVALEHLRSDVREDIGDLRDDMRKDNERLEGRIMAVVNGFVTVHGRDHAAQRQESDAAHRDFRAFIRAAELSQAKRDGALGAIRFVVEVVARNWRPLTVVLTAVTAVLFAATGDIRIEIVTR